MRHKRLALFIVFELSALTQAVLADDPKLASFAVLGDEYLEHARPLIERFCLGCHSAAKRKGELDLERFATLGDVRRDAEVWLDVARFLDDREMPPEGAAQPAPEERKKLRGWIERYLRAESLDRAGDPGPVVLRRLNNAEYTHTIRDLTGVDLDPAREFPADSSAGEGFTNAGGALIMSPALLEKYVDAAREVAQHAVLLPDGFRFSLRATRRDWTDEILARIRSFYSRFSEPGETPFGRSGRLPLERYFAATLSKREALSTGAETPESVAEAYSLNAKYLGVLWGNLTRADASPIWSPFRARWRSAKPEDAAALAAEVATWQSGLWAFNPVGVLGRTKSRSRWMEPVDPLSTRQEFHFEFHFEFPKREEGAEKQPHAEGEVVVSLVAGDAGDGNAGDVVLWQEPRFVEKDQADILLRDAVGLRGLDASRFGRRPDGGSVDARSLCVDAPSVTTFRLPLRLAAGRAFVTTAVLASKSSDKASVQVEVVAGAADLPSGLMPSEVTVTLGKVDIGAEIRTVAYSRPILVAEKSAARERFRAAMDEFRSVFPPALCYTQIVPVDESLTLRLFHREDDHLVRLILDEAQTERIDRLWKELRYVSEDALRVNDVLDSLLEATIGLPKEGIFKDAIQPIRKSAAAYREELVADEPEHVDALVAFAAKAYRRPLTAEEEGELRGLYRRLREEELSHEDSFRWTLARVFVASPFLYKLEAPPSGKAAAPVSDWELATRLSYFLWSSSPDEELRAAAAAGRLTGTGDELSRQTRRMLKDDRVRRLATEFAGQWLHIHDFAVVERKSEKQFPEFSDLRGDMYEETVLFTTDLFRRDGSLLSLLDADHTFVNERLAKFYGLPGVDGPAWRRVEGLRERGRGGILGFSATLAKQSGASRTSPILRGNWISEVLLGERLPRPPKNVPQLEDAVSGELTERQLIEQHSRDSACATCHARIDPFGFALEGFDAIGRRRERDVEDRPVDVRTTLPDGNEIEGLPGLRRYLLEERREVFLRQFCRKLLGYALGREVQLSDEPLLDEILRSLAEKNYRFSVAVETTVLSRQFRMIRPAGRRRMRF